jgi:hypothetical protein
MEIRAKLVPSKTLHQFRDQLFILIQRSERFSVQVSLPTNNYCKFELYDNNGRLVRLLQEDNFKAGEGTYSFNTNYLPNGTYFLKISNRGVLLQSEKISILR